MNNLTDTIHKIVNHPLGALGSSGTAVAVTSIEPPQDNFDLALKFLTLLIGVLPALRQIFKKKEK